MDQLLHIAVRTAVAGKVEMDYIIFGNGEKNFVILPGMSVHSITNSADAIAQMYRDFAEEYTIYVFDRAKRFSESYTVKEMADDTAAIMKSLHIKKASVFGASQGGTIALCLAIEYPELVDKMILGSTWSKPNETTDSVFAEWKKLADEKDEAGILEGFVDRGYSKESLDMYREIILSANRGITDEEFRRYAIMAEASRTFDCFGDLSEIHCPVLVLGAEGDRITAPEGSMQIAEALGCEIYMYDKFGHCVYDEAPDYRQRCLHFLRNH